MKREKVKEKYPPMLIVTVIAGALGGILLEILLKKLYPQIWTPLMVAIYFTVLAVITAFAVVMLCSIKGDKALNQTQIVSLAVFLILVFCVSLVAEVLYEMGSNKAAETQNKTAYIFVIDNSGSMGGNDPQNKREASIEKIMKEKGKGNLYSVYSFNSFCKSVYPLTEYGKGTFDFTFGPSGGTNIVRALRKVVRENKGLYRQGISAKVIMVTDGYSHSNGLDQVIRSYVSHGLSVSTIGVGDKDSKDLLTMIADGTGGVYVSIDNIDQLDSAMQTAAAVANRDVDLNRNLLGERFIVKNNALYAVLKVVLLSIIGVLFIIIKGMIINDSQDQKRLILLSGAAVLIAALFMEIGVEALGLPAWLTRIIMCVLFCIAVATKSKIVVQKSEGFFDDFEFDLDDKEGDSLGAQLKGTRKHDSNSKGLI